MNNINIQKVTISERSTNRAYSFKTKDNYIK
jgi:hypothetical protein